MFNGPFPVTLEFMSQDTKMTRSHLVSHPVESLTYKRPELIKGPQNQTCQKRVWENFGWAMRIFPILIAVVELYT